MNQNQRQMQNVFRFNSFPILVGIAFSVALLGLVGNLFHLQNLTNESISDFELTHPQQVVLNGRRRILNDNFREQHQQERLKSQEQVYGRMLRDSVAGLEECSHEQSQSSSQPPPQSRASIFQSNWMSARPNRLTSFGFMNALTNYLSTTTTKTPEQASENVVNDAQSSSPQQQQQEPQQPKCFYPPTTSCHTSRYTMLVTHTNNSTSPRRLFLNMAHWLTDNPNLASMRLVTTSPRWELLKKDVQYGRRIWDWVHNPHHVLELEIIESTIWDVNFTSLVGDAILWINGDQTAMPRLNQYGIDAGFELWKQHSTAIVGPFEGGYIAIKELTTRPERRKLQALTTTTETTTTLSSTKNKTEEISHDLIPFCKHEVIVDVQSSSVATTEGGPHFSDLHGVFVHANYLCFLSNTNPNNQAFLRNLKRFTTSIEESKWAIALYLAQLSGQAQLVYPSRVLKTGASNTSGAPPPLSLSPGNVTTIPDAPFVSAVTSFFGSLPIQSQPLWCGNNELCPKKVSIPKDQLPWIFTPCGR